MLPLELFFLAQVCTKSFVGWGFAHTPLGEHTALRGSGVEPREEGEGKERRRRGEEKREGKERGRIRLQSQIRADALRTGEGRG